MHTRRTTLAGLALAVAAASLAGCAALNSITSDVSTFGEWPAGRAPGTYAFERLPSQQARPQETERLENAARPVLEKAGFTAAEPGREPDVLVQVAARSTRYERVMWDDPLWWRGGYGMYRYGPWPGPWWGASFHTGMPRYEREVALLVRDRASGRPLFEARASNDAGYATSDEVLAAMFEAALADFPRTGINPRRVSVQTGAR